MLIKKLTLNEIKEIYEKFMPEAFPKSEIRPFNSIKALFDSGKYLALGGYDEDELKIYAMFCVDTVGDACLLDYFATTSSARGQGYGSEFFDALPENMGDFDLILLEVERIDAAKTAQEESIRTRRISFYQRNGCKISGVKSTVFTDDYNILYLSESDEICDDKIFSGMKGIYKTIFSPADYSKNVSLYY